MRLGEILVQKGAIDNAQLKEALDAQLIYGGHLGTCLIEMGFLNELRLGEVLSECFGIAFANHSNFEEIPHFVIATLPARIVEKHSVVPFRLKDKTLDVAMIDPKNLLALDEIAFASGYGVRPWIAPEARIYQAMERYYQVMRRQRYITLCRRMDEECAEMTVESAEHDRARTTQTPGADSNPTEAPAAVIVGAQKTLQRSEPTEDPLREVTDRLSSVETQDDLADAVFAHALRRMARAILFESKGGTVSVWKARGAGLEGVRRPDAGMPIVGEPVFGLVRGQGSYLGTLPAGPEFQRFYDGLGIIRAAEVVLAPAYVNDRLIALFYGDGGPSGRIEGQADEYRRLMSKFALGVNLIQIRRKLRSV